MVSLTDAKQIMPIFIQFQIHIEFTTKIEQIALSYSFRLFQIKKKKNDISHDMIK